MKVLIVEDDKWYAESLRAVLPAGFRARIADSPETAVIQVDDFQPEVILLDFQLGARNALTLLNELQSYTDTRQLPVVILATGARRWNLADFASYGVRAILDKSHATPAEIVRELSRVQ